MIENRKAIDDEIQKIDLSHPENWIKLEFWGVPKWIKDSDSEYEGFLAKLVSPIMDRVSYEEYFASQLRARYLDLQGDFLTIFPPYVSPIDDNNKKGLSEILSNKSELSEILSVAEYVVVLLLMSKKVLEKDELEKVELLTASSILDEVEQCMVWITPPDIKLAQIRTLRFNLIKLDPEVRKELESVLDVCNSELKKACGLEQENNAIKNKEPANKKSDKDTDTCNAAIEEVVKVLNVKTLDDMINTGLQIERLRSLRFWGIILLFLFILMSPMTSNMDKWVPYNLTISHWDTVIDEQYIELNFIKPWLSEFGAWYTALNFCIIGGIGGFLSGLLQVRSSRTNLGLYEESVLLFQIRPIFGAFAALVIFMLLSWEVFDDILEANMGSYVLVTFLSAFSERYFLKLLNVEPI